jgi:hypothetical protein
MVTPMGSMSTEGETPQVCPTSQVLDMSTVGDAADINPVIKFLPHMANHVALGACTQVPPVPSDLPQLRKRIMEAVAIDCQMLQCVWQELDYRIDICHIKGGHIEHL